MSSVRLRSVSFYYDRPFAEIFDELTLNVDCGWKTGLIGRNGRGKTTLLNLIRQQLTPTAGQIDAPARTNYFPYRPPDPSLPTADVVKDALGPFGRWEHEMNDLLSDATPARLVRYAAVAAAYEEHGGYQIAAQVEKVFASVGLSTDCLHRPFLSLSGGERTRALVAGLFLNIDGFPLIDEPTNHLDIDGREQLADFLRRQTGGFIVVSHDRHFLDSCCDHIICIEPQQVSVMQGNYSTWRQQCDVRQGFEQRRHDNLEREINQLKRASRQRRRDSARKEKEKKGAADKGAVGARAARLMQRALNTERRIQRHTAQRESLLKNVEKERVLKFETTDLGGRRLLTVNNLSVAYGRLAVIEDLSFSLSSGERIAVIGPNGSGKSSLLDAICGDVSASAGSIRLPRHVRVLRTYQEPLWATGSLRARLASAQLDETHFRQVLGEFAVTGDVFERPLETLSHGQLKKIDLCRSIASPCDLLIWDEPMNYIDILSREQIGRAILESTPTLLFVDHDRYFVELVATSIVEMNRPRRR